MCTHVYIHKIEVIIITSKLKCLNIAGVREADEDMGQGTSRQEVRWVGNFQTSTGGKV